MLCPLDATERDRTAQMRGERERLDEIQRSREFERLQTRAGMIVDGTVSSTRAGEALGRLVGHFEEAASDIGG
jgi:hypothetical protein